MINSTVDAESRNSTASLEFSNQTDLEWDQSEHSAMSQFIIGLDLYFVPIIILVGLLGNTTSFIVFSSTHLRTLSSSVYLAALAIADNGFLLSVFIMWTVNINWSLHTKSGWCQVFFFLTYFFSFLSVWYVVAFTVERFIAVCFPLKRTSICSVRHAKIVVTTLAVAGFLLYNFALWTSEVRMANGYPECLPKKEFFGLVQVMSNIDTVVTLIIPMVAILVLNVRIGQRMVLLRGEMKQIIGSRLSTASGCSSKRSSTSTQITKMLLVVSSTFLVLNLPSHAFRVHHFFVSIFNKHFIPSQLYADCQTLFQYVYYLNFATNFFLYSVCGRNFREAFAAKYTCSKFAKSRESGRWSIRRLGSERMSSGRMTASSAKSSFVEVERDLMCLDQMRSQLH